MIATNFQHQLERLNMDFTPFIFHSPHQPVPIAFVHRSPKGIPGHVDKVNPQNLAWIYAFRCAQKSILIQSTNFNASLAIDGYNYLKEGFGTFQGGTNERVVKKTYKKLNNEKNEVEKKLQILWYTAKDQTRPLHFAQKNRNRHVKFMSIDDEVAIFGSGNMDTQTWFHSQIGSPVFFCFDIHPFNP
ncbi:unnamed protein product [Adineta ricciae]|uniref:PLD phosphodiesterase domain-containing protein n=1 Tax=Adineta ricciae TaxID=249248 RepID=A0A815ZJZ9_ADIRI|nr:unnamed protein product [Adineta ricciae]